MSKNTKARNSLRIQLTGTRAGIGIKIVGGRNVHLHEELNGIFVKEILHDQLAERDGRLKVGDQLLQANSDSLVGVVNERAVEILRKCAETDKIDFLIARDKKAQENFRRLSQTIVLNSKRTGVGSVQVPVTVEMDEDNELTDISDISEKEVTTVELSEVRVSLGGSSSISNEDDLSTPPPLPVSLPPDEEDRQLPKPNPPKKPKDSRLSVNPSNKFRLQKLIWAVEYIGNKLTSSQQETLHQRLHTDAEGKVVFHEFLQVVQELLPSKLDQSKLIEAFTSSTRVQQHVGKDNTIELKDANERLRNENTELLSTIRMLEHDLRQEVEARENLNKTKLMRMLASQESEVKKSEASNRRYQVAIDILMKFVEDCQEALAKSKGSDAVIYYPHGAGPSVIRGDQVTGNPRPPQYLSKDIKKTSASLAKEAIDVTAEVRRILSVQALPYGWEEQYTEDGRLFYINHEQQITSWVNPLTKQTPTATL